MAMIKEDKKAISPIIATVLLIALVVSASAMIYAWSKSFIAEQLEKFGDPIEIICDSVKITAQLSRAGSEYELLINNQANVDIPQVNIKAYDKGRTYVRTFPADGSTLAQKAGTGKVIFTLASFGDIESASKFDVTPLLIGKGKSGTKLHPCTDKAIEGLVPQ